MKKIILLFAGAVASFFLFSYIDEYENLILPLLSEKKADRPSFSVRAADIETDFEKTIGAFHEVLAEAYISSNPSVLMRSPVDEGLIPSIAQEIDYLAREGRVMDMKVRDISINKIVPLSSFSVRVNTREVVEISYYSDIDREKVVSFPLAEYDMRYSLGWRNNRWYVLSFETIGVRKENFKMLEDAL